MHLPPILHTLSRVLRAQGARAIIVGGSVRDHFLQRPIKDYDIEVYGLASLDLLETLLAPYGSVNLVGKSFGVLKFVHDGEEYDFALPRQEHKVAPGHKGFDVTCCPDATFAEAARRRDFTMNAMGYDIEQKLFLDPFGGRDDMRAGILRHIDDNSFIEDPLRVYRAVQFCARFDYTPAPETRTLCREMVERGMLDELPKERIYGEFEKLLLKAARPSIGFEQMRELGMLTSFPELAALIGVPQEPAYHPEGDVWIHTMMSLDAMAGLRQGERKADLARMFAVLCHDLGKAVTTTQIDGRIRALMHEVEGVPLAERLLYRLTGEHDFIAAILPLVRHHLAPSQFYADRAKNGAIRRLATKVNIEELVIVAKADFLGRTTPEAQRGHYAAGEWLLEKARALKVEQHPLDNLLQGRDLIALGMKPSKTFKTVLEDVYEQLLEGRLRDKAEALAYVRQHYLKPPAPGSAPR